MPAWAVLVCCIAVSIVIRVSIAPVAGSDVLVATEEALQVKLHHHNPYTHYYMFTKPPGQPFPYLPGELAFYWIQEFVTRSSLTDRWAGIGAVIVLGLLAPISGCARTAIGVAFFGLCPLFLMLSVDGSNETCLTFLSFVAIVLFAYAGQTNGAKQSCFFAGSAIAFGWAIAFKEFSWVVFPFMSRCIAIDARRLFFTITLGAAAMMIAPALLADPLAFVRSILVGGQSHAQVWGFNVWASLPHSFIQGPDFVAHARQLSAAIALLATVAFWLSTGKTLRDAIVSPILVLATAFLLAPWSSLAYYSYCLALGALAFVVAPLKHPRTNDVS
jgi:hypothetical protein